MVRNIFAENKNLFFNLGYYNKEGVVYVSFVPFDREITLKYIKRWLGLLCKHYDDFVVYAQGFNFDGLYETNKGLIKCGCVVMDNLTGETISFKGDFF